MAQSTMPGPRGGTCPPFTKKVGDGYKLSIEVCLDEEGKADATIPPPGCPPDKPATWDPRDFQLLLVAAEYCAAVQELLTWTFPSPLWDGAKEHVLQCTSAFIAGRELPQPLCEEGGQDFPDWFAVAGRLAWANFTYCYFFGTHDLAGLPGKKPRGVGGINSKAAAAKAKAKAKVKGKGAAGKGRGQGAAAATAAAADGAGGGDGSEEDGGGDAAEDALLDMPPVAEQAYQWLVRLVGKKGWHPEGEVSQAIADWAKKTREWLDGSLGERWTEQHAAAAEPRNVSKTKPLKSADADKPFFPIYPYHVNSGKDNRVKCSLTTVRKKGKQQPAAAGAAAAGAEEDGKMERSFPTGCCGLPAEYGQASNCTLGFLVMSDVCEALIQAAEGRVNSATVTPFLYSQVLQHRTGAKGRKDLPLEHVAFGYPQLLASCVEGWERALAHVHTVWLPAALEAYLDATMSSPEDWEALEDSSSAAAASGSAANLVRPPKAPKPQMLLPCCIPPEEVLRRAEQVTEDAAERAAQLGADYDARVKQEQAEQEHRPTGPVPLGTHEARQSRLLQASSAAAAMPVASPAAAAAAGTAAAPARVPVSGAGLPGQAGCAAAAAATGAPSTVLRLPPPAPQQQTPQDSVWAMDVDADSSQPDPDLDRRMAEVRLGTPEPAVQFMGAHRGVGSGLTPLPAGESLLGLAERLRLAVAQDTERCRQQAGAGAEEAEEAALVQMFASLERVFVERRSVMRYHSRVTPGV
ncbi:hypothetical protein HYH02_006158 [Chlamydomonas schloesseri]|uniref:Uncharacterized protein n=1 Tax=Chlamydomonas schloesseri TaxID=2026947 RepID=A0A836B681_9CHLO|nr:hypothetical protein HYH02_006158 [Chlamydomonas schloesseri]|eukprot:KAG2448807.1 hypothetical protein HYH02_006158 [Chlamydomonas schloesseri]